MQERLIGRIAIDSGLVRIGDPCYEIPYDSQAGEKGELKHLGKLDNIGVVQALDLPSPIGDGVFDVYGIYEDDYLVQIVIDFT
jgi:hypothetical protein